MCACRKKKEADYYYYFLRTYVRIYSYVSTRPPVVPPLRRMTGPGQRPRPELGTDNGSDEYNSSIIRIIRSSIRMMIAVVVPPDSGPPGTHHVRIQRHGLCAGGEHARGAVENGGDGNGAGNALIAYRMLRDGRSSVRAAEEWCRIHVVVVVVVAHGGNREFFGGDGGSGCMR